MLDAFRIYSGKRDIESMKLVPLEGGEMSVPTRFCYMTCHREENTKDDNTLLEMLSAMETLAPDVTTVYPVHPRNRGRVLRLQKAREFSGILFVEPVGYLESVCLARRAEKIVTDSGGLQREAFFAQTKCVTISCFPTWEETLVDHRNDLAKPEAGDIVAKLALEQKLDESYQPFGDGHSAEKIVQAMEEYAN